jgi:GxxExxY protein
MTENELAALVVNAAFNVHKELGPGLLESAYECCLVYELKSRGVDVETQKELPIIYKGVQLNFSYRIDLLVGGKLLVELKSVQELNDIHKAQLITYLKLSKVKLGLLINFNEKLIKNGIKRVANGL